MRAGPSRDELIELEERYRAGGLSRQEYEHEHARLDLRMITRGSRPRFRPMPTQPEDIDLYLERARKWRSYTQGRRRGQKEPRPERLSESDAKRVACGRDAFLAWWMPFEDGVDQAIRTLEILEPFEGSVRVLASEAAGLIRSTVEQYEAYLDDREDPIPAPYRPGTHETIFDRWKRLDARVW